MIIEYISYKTAVRCMVFYQLWIVHCMVLYDYNKFLCNRGVSGALYLQSAIAGAMDWFGLLCRKAALSKWR